MIRIDTNLIVPTVRYDFGYCRRWGIDIGVTSDSVIIIFRIVSVRIIVIIIIITIDVIAAVVVVFFRLQFSYSCCLTFAMNTFSIHLTCLFDKSLRHRPQIIALGYHDVSQFAALSGHTNLGANIIFVDRMNKSK